MAARQFVCLHAAVNQDIRDRLGLLEDACARLEIPFVPLDSRTCNYLEAPQLSAGDILYNVGRGSRELECMLLRDGVASFFRDNGRADFALTTTFWSLLHSKYGIPVPKTVSHSTNDRRLLGRYVDYLGGFPLVVKVSGGTRGIGVIKIDSMHGLLSVVDHLIAEEQTFLLREFIEATEVGRLIVVGEKVVAEVAYLTPADDFRTSIHAEPVAVPREYSETARQTAVRAVHVLGFEFGGVDLIQRSDGEFVVLEVNSPASFQRPQRVTGVDIAGSMVHYLSNKADKLRKQVTGVC